MVMYYNAFQTKKKENLKYKHIIETHNMDVLMDIFWIHEILAKAYFQRILFYLQVIFTSFHSTC